MTNTTPRITIAAPGGTLQQLEEQRFKIAVIIFHVAQHFETTADTIISKDRTAPIALARHVAMHLARELTSASYPTIARNFKKGDHNTVIHACRVIPDRVSISPELGKKIAAVRAHIVSQFDKPRS